MKGYIEHLQNYQKPMGLGSLSGSHEDALNPQEQTDEEFEIEILEWVLELFTEPGNNRHDIEQEIQNRINKLE